MKELTLELSKLIKETVGLSMQLTFLKTGEFKLCINKGNDVKAEMRPAFKDPEDALKDAIEYIKVRQNPLTPYPGMPIGARFTIKRENCYAIF